MSHTPGPWRFQQDGSEPYWSVDMPRIGGKEYGSFNAMVYTTEADARLIACAPELLDALRLGLEWAESDGEPDDSNLIGWMERAFRVAARAALAKADGVTGES